MTIVKTGKEPNSPEEWADWVENSFAEFSGKHQENFKNKVLYMYWIEAICRAQAQARQKAIEECAKLAEKMAWETSRCPAPEIRSLLDKK